MASAMRKSSSLSLEDRILGCLLGGACGDALGAPVEFLRSEQIAERFGPAGIRTFSPAYGVLGAITDDTQMSLFTVEGLIRAAVRGAQRGIVDPPSVVHRAYMRWLATQERPYAALKDDPELDGWLIGEKRLWASRAPGLTYLSALRERRPFGEPAGNDSKGCGTVMRDAPFGFFGNAAQAFALARRAAKTTHGHPSAEYSSGALAAIVAEIVAGRDLPSAVSGAMELLANEERADEVYCALRNAIELSTQSGWRRGIVDLGEGWVAEEALAIAVLCALAADDPRQAIVAAVNHGGDSDSTGAIAGNLVGALLGPAALPQEWAEEVELRDVIEVLSSDLAMVVQGPFDVEALWERYPG